MDYLEIARTIGQPIDPNLPAPMALRLIANVVEVEPGEKVFSIEDLDSDVDEVIVVQPNCEILTVKRSPIDDVQLTFNSWNSKLNYICVDEMLNGADGKDNPDLALFARKKRAITRSMDKREVKALLDAIIAYGNITTLTPTSGEDLYDFIQRCIHTLEDYGDNYELLAGSKVKEAIDLYDKAKVTTHNYRIGIKEWLRSSGINVTKIFGKVVQTDGGSQLNLLDPYKLIIVAKDSTIDDGLPITFVRRKIGGEIARLMGAEVDGAQRAIVVGQTPQIIAGKNTLAFSVYGFESVIQTITNYKSIVKSADLTTLVNDIIVP